MKGSLPGRHVESNMGGKESKKGRKTVECLNFSLRALKRVLSRES